MEDFIPGCKTFHVPPCYPGSHPDSAPALLGVPKSRAHLLAKAEPSLSGQFSVFLPGRAWTGSRHPLGEEGRTTPNLPLLKLWGTLTPSFTSFVQYFLRASWEYTQFWVPREVDEMGFYGK